GGFLKAIRQAVERGLSPDDALRALTTDAARLLGVDEQIGSVSAGKLAHFVVTDGDIFDAKTKISEVWVRGRRYNLDVKPRQDLAGRWKLSFPRQRRDGIEIDLKSQPGLQGNLVLPKPAGEETKDDAKKGATKPEANDAAKKDDAKKDDAKEDAAKEDDAKEAETKEAKPAPPKRRASLKNLRFADSQLQFRFATADPEQTKDADVSAVVFGEPKVTHWSGVVTWPDGTRGAVLAERVPPEEPIAAEAKKDDAATEVAKTQDEDAKAKDDETKGETSKDKTAKPETAKTEQKTPETPIPCPVNFPLGPYGRLAPPAAAKLTVLQGATVWTCGPDGTIENASVLIEDGKVVAVGKSIDVPKGAEVIDVRGRHVTPGIIDCHSHMATDGGVNESGQNITAEVRIGDFINEDDSTIYRHLAGGVTSANILHGSANPIGGQNQVIKLRWGELGEDLKFRAAPAGIKFALGENVKQANWGDNYRTRYPQSRMGVEQLFQDAFRAGRAYAARWKEWEETRRGLPPRRDLELDAIREILAKERWIHCHSYRQDEILAFLRVLESFDVQIGSLQHILEGYKIADVLAKHGATASAFSDWWAYKFEVIDAIPYAGALMHEQGVVVSFNSDDRELGRHLNHEAAKAVRYGGVSEIEALKFVTLNPAKQLRIAHRVGSLEAGKDADFVVWSGHPLSTLSRCEQTWIDGRKYFDLESDKQSRTFIKEWRARLVDRVTKSGDRPKGSGPPREPGEEWSGEDEFCRHSHDDEHRHEENDAAEGGRR
ncbi:MAG: amidohydrolase family protein, partial [Planctomycetota bacterium]